MLWWPLGPKSENWESESKLFVSGHAAKKCQYWYHIRSQVWYQIWYHNQIPDCELKLLTNLESWLRQKLLCLVISVCLKPLSMYTLLSEAHFIARKVNLHKWWGFRKVFQMLRTILKWGDFQPNICIWM